MPIKLVCVACTLFLFASGASAATIPAGTNIDLRLTTEVSSDKPSGQAVSAVVIAPVSVNGAPVLWFGVQLSGVTADVKANKAAETGNPEEQATLRLQFTKIQDAKGQSKDIATALVGVDNARESVDSGGLISGI